MITSLMEEVSRLKKDLQLEKEKSKESGDWMECTLKKTKNIRKIHEKASSEKEADIEKLKEKTRKISKLRMELNDA